MEMVIIMTIITSIISIMRIIMIISIMRLIMIIRMIMMISLIMIIHLSSSKKFIMSNMNHDQRVSRLILITHLKRVKKNNNSSNFI